MTGGPTAPDQPTTSAAALAEDAIVRFRGDRPRHGWRRAVLRLSGGLVNPGVGPEEELRQQYRARIRGPLPGPHRIAVGSIKGGVGKTTVAACLGLVLAENRGDRVAVLDADTDAGTLADRLGVDTAESIRGLVDFVAAQPGPVTALTDVAPYLGLSGRLHVLASDQSPTVSEALGPADYELASEVLTRFHDIVITDSGTGMVHPVMRATLRGADGLVVVGSPTVDGASRAAQTLDWLDAHDHGDLAADAVVALSMDRSSDAVDVRRVREHFARRCRAVVEVPHDPHLATGAVIEPARLAQPTLDAFLEMAALLADRFGRAAAPPARA
ncbi:MinD/ParA family ATP-binding protein [Pseudonocardia humida]|uniref:MinD/ParA family protein n=1 Tax=Pseudonocardia humida TaxID=2800819 RepID=A0ABT0ZUD8_9PSEU|nr:MinD/ParA family protein [Pseudonocardia humida]MCO1654338.1 MinD/ParA family protein [Pseudonocardia humida]